MLQKGNSTMMRMTIILEAIVPDDLDRGNLFPEYFLPVQNHANLISLQAFTRYREISSCRIPEDTEDAVRRVID
jgi:hypothetical protein